LCVTENNFLERKTTYIAEFTRRTGEEILGHKPASGTKITEELGAEHIATGEPIVYTLSDSKMGGKLCELTLTILLFQPHPMSRMI
jgi:phosphopentomutase